MFFLFAQFCSLSLTLELRCVLRNRQHLIFFISLPKQVASKLCVCAQLNKFERKAEFQMIGKSI